MPYWMSGSLIMVHFVHYVPVQQITTSYGILTFCKHYVRIQSGTTVYECSYMAMPRTLIYG